MKAQTVTALTGFVLLAAALMLLFAKPVPHHLQPDILQRSRAYIRELAPQPWDSLPAEKKLLLFHAYFNVGNYAQTVNAGEKMIPELRALPPVRREAFASMLREAYQKLGRNTEADSLSFRLK